MSNLHAALGLAQTEKADEYKKMRMTNHTIYRKLSHFQYFLPNLAHRLEYSELMTHQNKYHMINYLNNLTHSNYM